MGMDWYDEIARRNGGYRNNAVFYTEGISAEPIFERRLIEMLPGFDSVLDAGCGHGDFTIRMAEYTNSLIGFDNSVEMINIAQRLLIQEQVPNLQFFWSSTKNKLPFVDHQFDLIYDRRGPTSVLNHSRILRPGGKVFGIHSGALDKVRERLEANGFIHIEIEEFHDEVSYFPDEKEFAKFISGIPGNPDYTDPNNGKELENKIKAHVIDGRLGVREYRYIWKARKTE
ncbi:methyltransferase type 11 [Bacillus sp. FJAT-27264]|nr:methyltransferase type 11 [Bacillus sp. FJAT-27264]